jgi:ribonuclease R
MVSIVAKKPTKKPTKKKSQSKANPRVAQTSPITASEVLALLAEAPLGWRELVTKSGRDSPQAIKQLRLMVKGLQRNGEIRRDHTGDYHANGAGVDVTGTVVALNNRLYIEDVAIELARKQSLRAGDKVIARITGDQARIVEVVAFSDEPVYGILRVQGRFAFVESMSKSYKGRISLLERPAPSQASDGDTVSVRVVNRDRRGLVGELLEVLVSDSVVEQAINTTIQAHGIPTQWPAEVDKALAKLPTSVAASDHRQRRDLQALPLVTIDGETAKDFDDAVYAEPLAHGSGHASGASGWRLVVAIADVGHYVKPGSALDIEAETRGTSVYFPDRVVPMLPEALSNELCSLKPNVPRLAMVCDMQVSADGVVRQHDFYEAVIRSHARLTYASVQQFLDGADLDADLEGVDGGAQPQVGQSLNALQELFVAFRVARDKRGGLDFTSRECAISINDGRVSAVAPVQRLATHQLIEEAMIAANVAAAEFLEAHDGLSLYRVHESPDVLKLEELRQALAGIGINLPAGQANPHTLKQVLERLADVPNGWLYEQMVLRCMQQATYTPKNEGHFGLALERYMHFTSPIRRYPDLLVHRAIKAALNPKLKDKPRYQPDLDRLQFLGEQCSHTERRAESAGWTVDSWLKCDYLREHVGTTIEGFVAGVTDFGLFVELSGYYVQGLLHVSELGSDYFNYNPATASLVGERSGQRFSLGDSLKVRIVDVDPPQGRIDLRLTEATPNTPRKRKGRKRG